MKAKLTADLTTLQFASLISGLQISVAYLSLPRQLAEGAGTDGWMTIPVMWMLSVLASLCAVRLMRRMPEGTILDLISQRIGAWAGKTAALVFGCYFATMAYDGFVRSALVTGSWLLPETAVYVKMLLLLVPAYVLCRGGPLLVGRYAEFVFLITCWTPLIYLYPLRDAHWLNLLPLFKEGVMPVLTGIPRVIFSFVGFAAVLFLYPNLKRKSYAVRGIVLANSLTGLIYLWITIVCFVYFSPDEIGQFNQPVLSMLKTVQFRFMERIEVPFIAFYLFVFSMMWVPCTYLTAYCSSCLLGKGSISRHLLVYCMLLAVSSYFYFPSYMQSDNIEKMLGNAGAVLEYMLPVALLAFCLLQEKLRRRA